MNAKAFGGVIYSNMEYGLQISASYQTDSVVATCKSFTGI